MVYIYIYVYIYICIYIYWKMRYFLRCRFSYLWPLLHSITTTVKHVITSNVSRILMANEIIEN